MQLNSENLSDLRNLANSSVYGKNPLEEIYYLRAGINKLLDYVDSKEVVSRRELQTLKGIERYGPGYRTEVQRYR